MARLLNKNAGEWKRGNDDELGVINWLKELTPDAVIKTSSKYNNINNGIDGFINSIPFDVKSQKYSPSYRGFCFEEDVCYARETRYNDEGWVKKGGWFYTGKARLYYFLIEHNPGEHTLYEVDKYKVIEYGFNYSRNLSPNTVARQKENGHNVIDAVSSYIFYDNYIHIGRMLGCTRSFSKYRPQEVAHTSPVFQRPLTKVNRAAQVEF
jgi:hypothetical protein